MPRVAYSQQDRQKVRENLQAAALELVTEQGVRATTVEQIYRRAGISRTFFYSFYSGKEDLIVEATYMQQPKLLEKARDFMSERGQSWREKVMGFFLWCSSGVKNNIFVMSIEEQQIIFSRLSRSGLDMFRKKQYGLFASLLEIFGVRPVCDRVNIFINLLLSVIVIKKAVPGSIPFMVEEYSDKAMEIQLEYITDFLENCIKQDKIACKGD